MALTVIWVAMVSSAVIFSLLDGSISSAAAAALDGAADAVTLCLSMGGAVCLWSGIIEVLRRAGAIRALTSVLRRPLTLLFPSARRTEVLEPLAANVSANLLGLGNAATPAGIQAAKAMNGSLDTAGDDLCLLTVLNTASLQLVPTTAAAIRSASGAAQPFDIIPAVWFTSLLSLTAGLFAAKVLAKFWKRV